MMVILIIVRDLPSVIILPKEQRTQPSIWRHLPSLFREDAQSESLAGWPEFWHDWQSK